MRTKILIIDEKISLLKAQERRWYIDVIAQEDNGRITTQKNLHVYPITMRKIRTLPISAGHLASSYNSNELTPS